MKFFAIRRDINDATRLKTKLKTKRKLGKKKHTGLIVGIIVIAGIIGTAFYFYFEQSTPPETQWITSGPFAINKNQYKIGEYVFMVVSNLKPTDVGEIDVADPKGGIFTSIPFNGTMKTSFHQFFKPNTERGEALCTPADLVGQWNIIFKGVPYKSIPFEIVNDWIPGGQQEIKPVPKGLTPC